MPNSRSKGNRNERLAAELLTKWTKRKFQRTPSSGGLQWKSSFAKGDIVCTKEGHYFPFCVEVKAHKEIKFTELLMPGKKQVKVLDFWKQTLNEAKEAGKIPMLLMRYNGMPKELFFMGLPTRFVMRLPYTFPNSMNLELISYLPFTFIPSDDLFVMNYKEIKKIAKKYIKDEKR